MFQQDHKEFEQPLKGHIHYLADDNSIAVIARRLSNHGKNVQVTFSEDFSEKNLPMQPDDKLLIHAYDTDDQDVLAIGTCQFEVRSGTLYVTNIEVAYAYRYNGVAEHLIKQASRITGMPHQEFGAGYFKYL